ncbi:manganese efflux pump MntP [Rhodobium gokarnense]|uniref:Putative manganese efflux pump MntP n=1 Tax=Rhodobium gokarnense TaxID=364296 RepID=A0ABT3HCN9_9HYPH|nr:manganese efflux pump MntP family protein [Rhodobium gokarnense]MCW2308114.1 putative Mn2+ efflux pump MntP [Rhodobium gokarnense]
MSPLAIGVLAVSMSIDAFIASLGKGAASDRPSFGLAIRTGAIFGIVEAITPLIGWAAGVAAASHVEKVDHWIAFGLLAAVGLRMVYQAWTRKEDERPPQDLWMTIATAVGTSIDAMAVGVSLAFLDVNILIVAAAIGLATMTMSSTGVLAGRFLGRHFGRAAEMLGGCALLGLGALILYQHLSVA